LSRFDSNPLIGGYDMARRESVTLMLNSAVLDTVCLLAEKYGTSMESVLAELIQDGIENEFFGRACTKKKTRKKHEKT
jgi:hypothetical protein